MDIRVSFDSGDDVAKTIMDRLVEYNERYLKPAGRAQLTVSARDDSGGIVGGAVGAVYCGRLMLSLLWIDEAHRSAGLGSRVLRTIEEEAKARGATSAFLDTFSFQAAPFYEKHGYTEIARIPRFFGEHDRIYMMKPVL